MIDIICPDFFGPAAGCCHFPSKADGEVFPVERTSCGGPGANAEEEERNDPFAGGG
jgi:hypothetical protein